MMGMSESLGMSDVGCHTGGSARKNARMVWTSSTGSVSLKVNRKISAMKTMAIQPATENTPVMR